MSQGQRYSHCSGAAPPAWFFSRYTWRTGPLRQQAGSATRRRAVLICSLWTGSSFVSGLVATGARPPRRVAPIRRSLSSILFFGKEYALRSWKGNPVHFPFHADAWKRPYPKTRAPEHIGIYCPCTQVSNSDDSLSGVLESRVRFFRLALLPFPFHCRMVGENRAKETGRFPSFRNISALSVALLRSRGICGTPEPVLKETQEQPGVRCPALPGDGPGRTCPGALMKRRHRSRKEWRGRMARLDRFSVYCPCRRMVLFPQTDGGKRTCREGRGRTEERSAFLLGRGALRAGRG